MTRTAAGQFDFDDGGTYCGGSEGGKAHGFGVCTGPGGHGEYSGAWQFGFEVSGVYTWPNRNDYAGQWMQGKRHGLGVERRGHWIYRGEWTQGFMGRYGVRQSTTTEAKYEGTWTSGLHDGYGLETYSDGGTYQGQWMKGMRHGYGVRKSALLSKAAFCPSTKVRRSSLTSVRSEVEFSEHQHLLVPGSTSSNHLADQAAVPRIGFFLKGKIHEKALEQKISFFSIQKSTNKSNPKRPESSNTFIGDENDGKFSVQDKNSKRHNADEEQSLIETYIGEWKNDKRSGFGVCERSDGLKYEGEWLENCKTGYGVTLFPDGAKEEGKYKNNVLTEQNRKMHLLKATKLRERIDLAVAGAQKASQIALQKSDIANSRMESARSKAELAMEAVDKARLDSEKAKHHASEIFLSEPNSGPKKVTKRLSIPRHNMVDIKIDPQTTGHREGGNQIRTHNPDNQELQSYTICTETRTGGTVDSVTETESCLDSLQTAESTENHYASEIKKGDSRQTQNSKMNHVASLSRLERLASLNSTEKLDAAPENSNHYLLTNTSLDFNEVDHLAEIENIFSYLAEEEKDMEEHNCDETGFKKINQSLLSRPSLKYRRDVRCPNLVIVNHGLDTVQKPATLKRRLTMPSIMKYAVGDGAAASNHSQCVLESKAMETIVIDNGVRKHLEEEVEYRTRPGPPDIDPVEEILEPPGELPKRYRLESVKLTKKAELGSLPNVSMFRRLEARAIPRHEAQMLCQQKREEMQQFKELDDELRRRALVLKIGDIKEWCGRHGIAILIIAVNLVLATLFSKLLS